MTTTGSSCYSARLSVADVVSPRGHRMFWRAIKVNPHGKQEGPI
jgi:hypothetical protein